MKTKAGEIYHIYNEGNRGQKIFRSDANYILFLKLFRKLVKPHCEILAYCLMPHDFHFVILANENSSAPKPLGRIISSRISNGFRLLQSVYARLINAERAETGSLFRQKAVAELLEADKEMIVKFIGYLHLLPLNAALINRKEEWPYSSFKDLTGLRNGSLFDAQFTFDLLNLEESDFLHLTNKSIAGLFDKQIF